MEVKVKKLVPHAHLPEYATSGAACFDLRATHGGVVWGSHVFNTGLAFEVPEGHVMLVFSRSGHGFKNNVRLANCVGVIDSDYRGEVKIKLTRDLDEQGGRFIVERGDRIAQAMILPLPRAAFQEVEELSDTARGAGGFGSTGAA